MPFYDLVCSVKTAHQRLQNRHIAYMQYIHAFIRGVTQGTCPPLLDRVPPPNNIVENITILYGMILNINNFILILQFII